MKFRVIYGVDFSGAKLAGRNTWTSARIETTRSNFKAPSGGLLAIEGRIQMPNVTGIELLKGSTLARGETGTSVGRVVDPGSGDEEDARDVVQDACIRAFKSIKRFRGEARFSTWMYRITANCAATHLGRRQQAQPAGGGAQVISLPISPTMLPAGSVNQAMGGPPPRRMPRSSCSKPS